MPNQNLILYIVCVIYSNTNKKNKYLTQAGLKKTSMLLYLFVFFFALLTFTNTYSLQAMHTAKHCVQTNPKKLKSLSSYFF